MKLFLLISALLLAGCLTEPEEPKAARVIDLDHCKAYAWSDTLYCSFEDKQPPPVPVVKLEEL